MRQIPSAGAGVGGEGDYRPQSLAVWCEFRGLGQEFMSRVQGDIHSFLIHFNNSTYLL